MDLKNSCKKAADHFTAGFTSAGKKSEKEVDKSAEGMKRSLRKVEGESDKAARHIESSFTRTGAGIAKASSAVLKLGGVIAAAFGVKKLVDFGKSCIDLGSDLAEVQNVVDVTYSSLSSQVDSFAQSAITSYGISETMAKKFVGTFGAMSKAFGFTEAQAYEMSTTLTGLSGDVASFYNITQDEAYTKLKAVFTGETEGLKELGVVMTQTALDAFAMSNGFGKTVNQMTEAEKVSLRYAFVQEKLAAAQGDFSRTSGGWANQVRVLTLQFDSLKATIGQGLINLFTPILQVINQLLAKLATLANAFKAFTELITGAQATGGGQAGIADMAAGLGDTAQAADNVAESTAGIGDAAKKAAKDMKGLMGFDKINKMQAQTSDTSSGSGTGKPTTGSAGGTGVDFGSLAKGETVVDKLDSKFTKMLENIRKAVKPTLDALKKLREEGLAKLGKFTFKALMDFYRDFLVPVAKWTMGTGLPGFINALNDGLNNINWDYLNDKLRTLWAALTPFAINVGAGLLWFWQNVLVPLGTWTANEVVPRFLETLANVITIVNAVLEALQPLFQWFWDSVLVPIAQWTGGVFLTVWDGINSALQKFGEWCKEHPGTIQTITTVLASFIAAWKIVSTVVGLAEGAAALWTIGANIATAVTTGLGAAVAFLTSPFGIAVAAIGAAITAGVLLWRNWDTVKEKAAQLRDWIVGKTTDMARRAVEKFEDLKTKAGNALGILRDSATQKWGQIKDAFGTFDGYLTDVFSRDWTEQFGSFGNIINAFCQNAQNAWDDVKGVFNGVIEFLDGVFHGNWEQAWNGIVDTFKSVFGLIADAVKTPINNVIGLINAMIDNINSALQAVEQAFTFRIGFTNPFTGAGHYRNFSCSLPRVGQIPMLADGGYVRANTPQLAIVGDNRHQGEIIAPEDKLEKMAMMAARYGGSGITREELERMINNAVMRIVAALADMGFYLDGEKLARAQRAAQDILDIRYSTVGVE